MNKIIIADTSCLIALDKIDCLYVLEKLYSSINITTQIREEFGNPLPNWFTVHDVTISEKLIDLLDAGEASALTLAVSVANPLVIIDEKKGRKIARELNIEIIGTLKILLLAKQKGILQAIKPFILQLASYSFRFSKPIVDEILLLANEQ